jgi:hypothetical protein
MKCSAVPFNIWRSLIEKAGYKEADITNTIALLEGWRDPLSPGQCW